METIQDRLREEARDYQDLSRIHHIATLRIIRWGKYPHAAAVRQRNTAKLSSTARSSLFELIGAEPEEDGYLTLTDLCE